MSDQISTLVRILSAEPLPRYPEGVDPEVLRYVRDLHNYLRRLLARLTGENITHTIDVEVPLSAQQVRVFRLTSSTPDDTENPTKHSYKGIRLSREKSAEGYAGWVDGTAIESDLFVLWEQDHERAEPLPNGTKVAAIERRVEIEDQDPAIEWWIIGLIPEGEVEVDVCALLKALPGYDEDAPEGQLIGHVGGVCRWVDNCCEVLYELENCAGTIRYVSNSEGDFSGVGPDSLADMVGGYVQFNETGGDEWWFVRVSEADETPVATTFTDFTDEDLAFGELVDNAGVPEFHHIDGTVTVLPTTLLVTALVKEYGNESPWPEDCQDISSSPTQTILDITNETATWVPAEKVWETAGDPADVTVGHTITCLWRMATNVGDCELDKSTGRTPEMELSNPPGCVDCTIPSVLETGVVALS